MNKLMVFLYPFELYLEIENIVMSCCILSMFLFYSWFSDSTLTIPYSRSSNAVKKKINKIYFPCKHGFVDKPDAIKTTVCFDPDSVGLIDFAIVWVGLDAFVFV